MHSTVGKYSHGLNIFTEKYPYCFFQRLRSNFQFSMKSQLFIKKFVQNVLGCTCPDKVFEQIEDRMVASTSSSHTRSITVGGRLLIYVWEVNGVKNLQEGILAMLETGKKERDARGLNRFRAVLAVETPQTVAPQADLIFSLFEGKDDRMHIHVVLVNDLKNS